MSKSRAQNGLRAQLPAQPLADLIKQRAKDLCASGSAVRSQNKRGGVAELGRRYGEAVGLTESAGRRTIERTAYGEKVTVGEADRLCCFLGKHPAEVYGEAWWNA